MKQQRLWFLFVVAIALWSLSVNSAIADPPPGFKVYKIKPGDTFSKIAPPQAWLLIKKVNRIDMLYAGKKIFVPTNLELAQRYCPVPRKIPALKKIKKIILINIHPRAQWFGAYEFGRLTRWGPISSGRRGRRTPTGTYQVRWKTKFYYSKKYKADMPYSLCIHNRIGLFVHQQHLPGRPDSHGCIRLLMEDAKWLFKWTEIKTPVLIFSQPPTDKDEDDDNKENVYLAIKNN